VISWKKGADKALWDQRGKRDRWPPGGVGHFSPEVASGGSCKRASMPWMEERRPTHCHAHCKKQQGEIEGEGIIFVLF
jgi:hypothetical protein